MSAGLQRCWRFSTRRTSADVSHRRQYPDLRGERPESAPPEGRRLAGACPRGAGPRHRVHLERQLREGDATSRLVSDAHLAALATEHALTVVTADRDFGRF